MKALRHDLAEERATRENAEERLSIVTGRAKVCTDKPIVVLLIHTFAYCQVCVRADETRRVGTETRPTPPPHLCFVDLPEYRRRSLFV